MSNPEKTRLIEIELNGKKLLVSPDKSILEVAGEQGIEIPTLCHDPRLESYSSCWICLVLVEGGKGFVPACSTRVQKGMRITTDNPDISSARKMALELLLSNHYGDCKPPCTLSCPSNIDVQGYVGLIANKKYREALQLIKRENPLPSVIGRICPRPCEEACRRNLVDEPVGIDWLKRYAADLDIFSSNNFDPPLSPRNGKHVAIVGAGPAGLSAAYYLIQKGVSVTIFEAEDKAGGMLRYGIPDYRLPQEVLDLELNTILKLGVELNTGVRLGEDIHLQELRRSYDSVILAFGAWKSSSLRVKGEDCRGVLAGINFLRDVAGGKKIQLGKSIAVIGGGNTAVDAARTSIRLGAGEVYLFYRRTRKEMPASEMEIDEAVEEGVNITYLAAPVRITGNGKGIESIRLIKMRLGEPDDSGRSRPIPVEGSEFDQKVDNVIAAIGQYSDTSYLEEMDGLIDERGHLVCDPETGETPVPGLFAAGDLVTGPDIAIRAIAGGKHAAASVLAHLNGKKLQKKKEFLSKKEDFGEITPEDYKDEPRIPLEQMGVIAPEQRRASFLEIEQGYSEEQALKEADRCMGCGCQDLHECELKHYAEEYDAIATRFMGEIQRHPIDESHPYILRDPSKCILCGRCVRICLEVQGIGVFGYIYRGFKSLVAPSFNVPYGEDELCISCGQCVSACPVGALTEKLPEGKTVPLDERVEEGFCSLCSVGCPVEYRYHGSLFTRMKERYTATDGGRLCKKGKFEHTFLNESLPGTPLGPGGKPISLQEAKELLDETLGKSKKPLLRLSPFLCGEAIERFLQIARERGIAVEPFGLAELNTEWQKLLPTGENGYIFEEKNISSEERVVILVGNLEESNNVAFTECLAMRNRSLCRLRAVGREHSVYDRFFDRVIVECSGFAEILKEAEGENERVDILLNPEEVLKLWGRKEERKILEILMQSSSGNRLRITLFWNSRNAGYLLRSIAATGVIRNKDEDYDLFLEVGTDLTGPVSGKAVIQWARRGNPGGNCLFIPLPLPLWIAGYTEPSGKRAFWAGKLDKKILGSLIID